MKRFSVLVLLAIVGFNVTADENNARKNMMDGLYNRWKNVAENCIKLRNKDVYGLAKKEEVIVNRLTPSQLQIVLKRQNQEGKTLAKSRMKCNTQN